MWFFHVFIAGRLFKMQSTHSLIRLHASNTDLSYIQATPAMFWSCLHLRSDEPWNLEFGFLSMGHEFDNYPKGRIRPPKDWNWFLEEIRKG
uniref:Uncharacterized protein n=1 Tax=Aegilops tauschii subsp. strangulata TaxID=200361 RepID=A0A453SCY7_AEGTS